MERQSESWKGQQCFSQMAWPVGMNMEHLCGGAVFSASVTEWSTVR